MARLVLVIGMELRGFLGKELRKEGVWMDGSFIEEEFPHKALIN